MSPGTPARGIRNRHARPRFHRLAVPLFWMAALPFPARAAGADAMPGRIVVELTEAGARALRQGRLTLPVPPGGESRSPRLAPLFVTATGPLARYAVLTFRPDAADGPDPETAAAGWIETLRRSPDVVGAEPDRLLRLAALPDDPYFAGNDSLPSQFHLWNPGGLSLNAAAAWPFVPAGREVVVAVLDSGVDWHHPDLAGPAPPGGRIRVNAAEASGVPGVDDDQNGFVDDVVGWDFVHLTAPPGGDANPAPGEDATTPDADPADQAGHGTQVAGLITAITGNGVGLAGAAPCASLLPVRVAWLGQNGGSFVLMSFCAQGIEYAARNGAGVINCSWDSGNIEGLGAAVDEAIQAYDVVLVASAGNDGTTSTSIEYLGSRNDVLAVAGILVDGKKATKSNYGSWVEIAAFYRGMPTTGYNRSTQVSTYLVHAVGGTSFAAPQVAAEAALLRAVDPSANGAAIRNTVVAHGRDLSDLEPVYASGLGGGLADVKAAVQALGGGWDTSVLSRGLLPAPDVLGFAFLADSTLDLVDAESGLPAPGWAGGVTRNVPGATGLDPVWVRWEEGAPPILVWPDGSDLRAVRDPGGPVPGWPVSLPPGASGLLAAPRGTGGEAVLVPYGDDVLVLEAEAGGVASRTLGLGLVSIAASSPATDSTVLFAGVDTTGSLVLWRDAPGGPGAAVLPGLHGAQVPPVIGEFSAPGQAEVVFVAPDSLAPGTLQHLSFVEPSGNVALTLDLDAPPVRFLSLAGFAPGLRVAVVAVDQAGGVHVVERSGAVQSVSASGPVAGEALCADVDGDFASDLLVLTRDGVLRGWTSTLQPLAGFPRIFPSGFEAPPVLADGAGTRFVVLADTAGVLWSVPLGPSFRPDPWTAPGGGPARARFLGFDRATPVDPQAVLRWETPDPGRLCWEGSGLRALTRLRLRGEGGVFWEGVPTDAGCAAVPAGVGETVLLEGLGREGFWQRLARATVPAAGLRAAIPSPNPFREETRIRWSGARGGVRIRILDVQGRLILDRQVAGETGEFRWNGRDDSGVGTGPGIYFMRLGDGRESVVRRVLRLP